jgi:hypothetical protein
MIKRPDHAVRLINLAFSAPSRRANSSTELVSSRVSALINSGYLGADATVGQPVDRATEKRSGALAALRWPCSGGTDAA